MSFLPDICICCLWTQTSSHYHRVTELLPKVCRCWVMLKQVGSQKGSCSCIINSWWLVWAYEIRKTQNLGICFSLDFETINVEHVQSVHHGKWCLHILYLLLSESTAHVRRSYNNKSMQPQSGDEVFNSFAYALWLFVSLDKRTYIKMTTEIFAKGLGGCHSRKVSRLWCRLSKSRTCFENKQSVASFPVPQPHFICNSLMSGVCFILQRLVVKTNLQLFPVVCTNLEAAPMTAQLYLHSSHTVTFCIMSHCQTLSVCILTSRSSLFVVTESFHTVSSSMEWNINII